MSAYFGDRLVDAIRQTNAPVCVGFDPLLERLPPELLANHGIPACPGKDSLAGVSAEVASAAIEAFGKEVIRAVAEIVPAIKMNIAFFEPYHSHGIRAYGKLVRYAQDNGLLVIGDVKRSDIGHSAAQYARAQLAPINGPGLPDVATPDVATPDSVTVNPYFGYDGIGPFVDTARGAGRGLFILVQTSNESATQIQGLQLSDGSTVCEAVARLVHEWGSQEGLIGNSGYSSIGAVVSPRDLASTERIRSAMPHTIFLVPGFGAQGRTAREVSKCFNPDGTGALVNASRSVIYAYNDARYGDKYGTDWRGCITASCHDLVKAIRAAIRA